MNINSRIAVIGSKSQIGMGIAKELKKNNYKKVVLFDFEINDPNYKKKIIDFFDKKPPEYIFLSQGISGGILYNQKKPLDLMVHNLMTQLEIMKYSYEYKIKKLLFYSSSCVFPKENNGFLKPSDIMGGYLESTNQHYAVAKIAGMNLCDAYNKQYNTNFISAIPSNPFGPGDKFHIQDSHVIPGLILKMHKAKITNKKRVEIWGTGNPIRDFIFVEDLASASIKVMQKYKSCDPINLSSGQSYSIKDIANIIKDEVNYKGKLFFNSKKPDGMKIKVLDNSILTKLGWKSKINIKKSINKTYKWYLNNLTN